MKLNWNKHGKERCLQIFVQCYSNMFYSVIMGAVLMVNTLWNCFSNYSYNPNSLTLNLNPLWNFERLTGWGFIHKLCHSIFIMLYQNVLEYTVHNNLNLFNLFLRKSRGGAKTRQPPNPIHPDHVIAFHFRFPQFYL